MFPLKVKPNLEGIHCIGKQTKLCVSAKMMEKYSDASIHLIPIALRMAKTLWSFGRYECNRVKTYVLRFHYDCVIEQILTSFHNIYFKSKHSLKELSD